MSNIVPIDKYGFMRNKTNIPKINTYIEEIDDRILYGSIKNIDELCENLKRCCKRTDSEIAWFRNEYNKYRTKSFDI